MKPILLTLFLLPLALMAQDDDNGLKFKYKGFAYTYHAVRSSDPWNFMSSRTCARLESGLEKGSTTGFVSLNAIYNPILEDETGLHLREAYLEHSQGNWGIKAGKQIVTWGVADGLQVTDIISPMDYTEFLAEDYDDIRIPVNAIRLNYSNMAVKAEAIWVPVPEFFNLPTDSVNPWAIAMGGMYCALDDRTPSKRLENSEFGGRVSAYMSGIDFSLCVLRTWNKMPAFQLTGFNPDDTLAVAAHHHRMTMVGADASASVGKFVVRAEVAGYFNQQLLFTGYRSAPMLRNQALALIGIDWYPGNDWTLMAQYCHTYTDGGTALLGCYRNAGMATANVSKALLRNTLKLSAYGRFDCANNGAFFIRFNADYNLTDEISLTAGYDWFRADAGMFAMYKDNSEIFVKAKFSF